MNPTRLFLARLGLHPLAGFGVFAVDLMLFGKEAATAFTTWPVSVGVAIVLAVGVRHIQEKLYGDTPGAAKGKAIVVGVLTAIPTAIPGLATATGGMLGAAYLLTGSTRRKVPEGQTSPRGDAS